MILSHATVLTMDRQRPRAEAVVLRGERIVVVGTTAEVWRLRHRQTAIVDCQGASVLPGFVDAHLHLRGYAATLLGIDCSPAAVHSLDELRALLRQQAQQRPPGQWLVGYGYDEFALAERRHPTRWDLDPATPQHPVRLAHRSRHAWVLNSLALGQLGITHTFAAPPGGLVERDATSGEPTGLVIGLDDYLRQRIPPAKKDEEFRQGVRRASQSLLAAGVTAVQDASVANDLAAHAQFRTWVANGDLALRLTLLLGARSLPELAEAGVASGEGSPRLRIHGIKIRLDESAGELYPPPAVLCAQVWQAHQLGFPVAIHALDVPALVAALQAIRLAQERRPRPHIRHRLEHCALCPEALLDELTALHVAVVTQPAFLWHHGARYIAEIPPTQQPWLYRVKSLLQRGIPVAGSSDAPVVPPRPLAGIQAAVTRQSADGQTVGPAERISVEEALWLFTQGAAWACGLEAEVGSITPGKLADLVVLDADPTQVPAEELAQIPVRMTLADGVVRWSARSRELCHL